MYQLPVLCYLPVSVLILEADRIANTAESDKTKLWYNQADFDSACHFVRTWLDTVDSKFLSVSITWDYPHRHSHVCLSVCPCSKRKIAWAIDTKHVYAIAVTEHALTQRSKSQRSRSHCDENHHSCTVASDHGRYSITQYAAVPPTVVAGVCLLVDMTAYVF